MSKVKIQGNASGTGVVTLTAPNTNTDRTITLPDGDITLGVGIADNATSTAITIDASENVGVGTASPAAPLDVSKSNIGNYMARLTNTHATSGNGLRIQTPGVSATEYPLVIKSNGGANDVLVISNDGRGLSQFTAKAWVRFNGTGTVGINDSHNVSSITDVAAGSYTINFTNSMANSNYAWSGNAAYTSGFDLWMEHATSLTTSLRINCAKAGSLHDSTTITAMVFGD